MFVLDLLYSKKYTLDLISLGSYPEVAAESVVHRPAAAAVFPESLLEVQNQSGPSLVQNPQVKACTFKFDEHWFQKQTNLVKSE